MLDASIYGMAGKVKSVADFDREALLADAARQQQQLTALQVLQGRQKADEYSQGVQRAEALRQLAGRWKADTTDDQRIVDLKNAGFATEADQLQTGLLKRKETEAKVTTEQAQARKAQLDNAAAQLSMLQNVISAAKDQASYTQGKAALAQAGLDVSQVPDQYDPAYVAAAGKQALTMLQRLEDERKKLEFAETQRKNLAGEKIAQGNLAVAQGNLGVARERLQLDRDAPKGVLDPERGLVVDPRTGEAKPVTVSGKPVAAKKASEQQQKVNDATDALALLDQAETLIPKSTSSYAGVAVDEAARLVGKSTQGAQAAAQLKALEGALISKMPKMSGPQSDKDVLLYKQMAGQIGDPTIPAETKKAAIKTIREINMRHAGATGGAGGDFEAPSKDAVAEALKKYLK